MNISIDFAKFAVASMFAMLTIFPCRSESDRVKRIRGRAAAIYTYAITPAVFGFFFWLGSGSIAIGAGTAILTPIVQLIPYKFTKNHQLVEMSDEERFWWRFGLLIVMLILFGADIKNKYL